MSKYNHFAREANDKAREAIDAIIEAKKARDAAQTAKLTAKDTVAKARAEANFAEAEQKVKDAMRAAEYVGEDFKRIRREIENGLADDNSAKPEDVDAVALELMKSGICTPGDYARMAEQYKGNRTMLRLLSKYAEDAAAGAKSGETSMQYRVVSYQCAQATGADRLDAFDVLTDVYSRTVRNNAMYGAWDSLTAEIVQNF